MKAGGARPDAIVVLPEGNGVAIACKGCLAYSVRLPFLAVAFANAATLRSDRKGQQQSKATVYAW
jgi:hypothetical protein